VGQRAEDGSRVFEPDGVRPPGVSLVKGGIVGPCPADDGTAVRIGEGNKSADVRDSRGLDSRRFEGHLLVTTFSKGQRPPTTISTEQNSVHDEQNSVCNCVRDDQNGIHCVPDGQNGVHDEQNGVHEE
jgi:hypothetical protein